MTPLLPLGLLLFTLCVNAQYRTGDVRLVGGSYQWEGRVEVYLSGTWGTVTDSRWNRDDAQVVCRKLGYFTPGAVAKPSAYFGEGPGPILMDYVRCTGTEYSLTDCKTRSSSRQSNHSEDVGVQCQPAAESYQEGDIRLVGGHHDWEGLVEIYISGTWGTISDESWTVDDAEVVCRQLGHSTSGAVAAQCCADYGQGSGPVHLDGVTCLGSEPTVTNCSYSVTASRNHQSDVGVHCERRRSEERPGSIRLVEGSFQWEGRVEIYLSGTWGTIFNRNRSPNEAKVVCRQLGYAGDAISQNCCEDVDRGRGPIVMSSPQCSGGEYRLTSCSYESDTSGKTHDRDWGVKCSPYSPEEGDIRITNNGGIKSYGYLNVFVSGMWGTVATDLWNATNTKVVCRQLGFLANGTFWSNVHIQGDPPNLIGDVSCTGSESRLVDCSHTNEESDSRYVVVNCPIPDCETGDIRLVEGQAEREGRVEICKQYEIHLPDDSHTYFESVWGTVCDNQWSSLHTEILCRYLGYAETGTYFGSGTFGQGFGPVFMDYINCNGSENSILDCRHFSHSYGCTHSDDVGVRCEPAMCNDGQVRLHDGIHVDSWSGVLEVCFNQRWGTVITTANEDNILAGVFCHQLGYLTGSGGRYYGMELPGGPKYIRDVQCFGDESSILDCSYSNYTGKIAEDYAISAACQPVQCQDGEMRLTEGTEQEGRLEMCRNQRWGTVSSDGWTLADAQVVCRSLGYETSSTDYVFHPPLSTTLSSPVYVEHVACSGTEQTLLNCSHINATTSDHSNDVGVRCKKASCRDGDIKLVNGKTENEGRVLICLDQRWGTVNVNGWSDVDTEVACRQLGYSSADVYNYGRTDVTSAPIHITGVNCHGQEERLIDCSYTTDVDLYIHRDDVGVTCYQMDVGPVSTDGGESSSSHTNSPSDHTDSPSDHTDSPSGHTDSPSGHPDSPSVSSTDSSNGGTVEAKLDSGSKAKITAALSVALVSLVVAALSLLVAGVSIIFHCANRKKKYGGYNEVQLRRQDSNESITDLTRTEDKTYAYATTTVETGASELL